MKQDTCLKIESLTYPVVIGTDPWREIDIFIKPYLQSGGIYLLTDNNTQKYCLPVLTGYMPEMARQPLFSISPGEQSKDSANLDGLWKWMMKSGAAKDSLLINLGGGVVSDLGGFAAATFNRGISYLNIPTSLISQVDAAIGGKSGINISGIKNKAGLFHDPIAVFINPAFLTTLPDAHLKSGYAEIIKCAALSGKAFPKQLINEKLPEQDYLFDLIYETVKFKCSIISGDPFDRSSRKMLNFGHTVGHALESFSGSQGKIEMLHGEAVAAGMICESYLSYLTEGLSRAGLEEITIVIKSFFKPEPINNLFFDQIIELMDFDKKKTNNGIGFSLLQGFGKPSLNRPVDRVNLIRSFEYFNREVQK